MNRHHPILTITLASVLLAPLAALAQLRTPTYGWNLGNTLEAPTGEGTWAPKTTRELIDAVADAGFNTVRLPVAWNSHADPVTYQINPAWMARIEQVVEWCFARDLVVILNSHWDSGWIENKITDTVDPTIDARMKAYWTQIANTFKDYDSRLLFAGANEPAVKTAGQMATLLAYYQTFVDAVRDTGGNNTDRWLVVQGPETDIQRTYDLMHALPSDPTPRRMIVEVHYYDPYPFALMKADADWGPVTYFWGRDYHHPTWTERNCTQGEEAWVEAKFQLMHDKFVSQGIPVLLGEFGSIRRTGRPELRGADLKRHLASRTYFNQTIVETANRMGLRPVYWDDSGLNPNSFGLFNRKNGKLVDRDGARALTGGAALPPSE